MHYPEDRMYDQFSRAYQLLLRYILSSSHFFLHYAFMQTDLDFYALFPNWNIRYFFADAYSPYIYYMHFVLKLLLVTNTSWNRVHVFTLVLLKQPPL